MQSSPKEAVKNQGDYYEEKYGCRGEGEVLRTAVALLKRHRRSLPSPLRILDVGGGNMLLSQRFVKRLNADAAPRFQICLDGWDVSKTGVAQALANGLNASVRDITAPLRKDEASVYDMILFFEVLEHLVDTDAAIRNIHTLLKRDGILVMSTPNLASWYNRLFLLIGNQPHGTEVSSIPIRFGNRIMHRLLGEVEGTDDISAGHLRVFTWKALREFLTHFGFDILGARGCPNHRHDLISRVICPFFPGLSGDVCVVARKREANDEKVRKLPPP